MDDKRQKNQLVLAFMEEDRGEAPKGLPEGTESSAGKRGIESPAIAEQLMEEVCERENCKQALKRVKANKGSPGVDGMTVHDLPGYLKQHWPAIREQLLNGTYKPQPVRRVEIPKPDGGVRKLGIPTVLDRFIQQAVMQVLQGRWDRTSGTDLQTDFPITATGFDLGARRIRRWRRRSSTSPKAIAGWWTWTWRNSSTEFRTTN
jgi:RNA-directed DNA polymerase